MILTLCKTSALRILNGRTPGDEKGNFTRYPSNIKDNPSTIDYALCSVSMMKEIKSFSVLPFTGLSDHCCISLTIKVNMKEEETPPNHDKTTEILFPFKNPLKIDKKRIPIFERALKDDMNVEVLRLALAQTNIGVEKMDNMISIMNSILINAAKRASLGKRNENRKNNKKKQQTHSWYTKECKNRQKVLRKCSKLLSTSPFDREKRQKFTKARADYKKVCRKAEAESRRHLVRKLMKIGQNDPKLFWDTIKKMNNWGKKQVDPSDDIAPEKWVDYFQNLLNDKRPGPNDRSENRPTFDPILDSKIKAKELRDALSNLKNNKAPGPDGIIGEYLKFFGNNFEDILLRFVNIIFSERIYPSKWAENFLKPIFKKDDTTDPDNYRGLAIGSAFAKLFSFILLKRLIDFIDIKNLISPEQIGFIKGKSTSDHIFLLQTIKKW